MKMRSTALFGSALLFLCSACNGVPQSDFDKVMRQLAETDDERIDARSRLSAAEDELAETRAFLAAAQARISQLERTEAGALAEQVERLTLRLREAQTEALNARVVASTSNSQSGQSIAALDDCRDQLTARDRHIQELEELVREAVRESSVEGPMTDLDGDAIIRLEDGTVWQQRLDPSDDDADARGSVVVWLCKSGQYRMWIEKANRTISVNRLR
jgi:hypothetical protein